MNFSLLNFVALCIIIIGDRMYNDDKTETLYLNEDIVKDKKKDKKDKKENRKNNIYNVYRYLCCVLLFIFSITIWYL